MFILYWILLNTPHELGATVSFEESDGYNYKSVESGLMSEKPIMGIFNHDLEHAGLS